MENEKPKRIVWYAATEDFARMGPFTSEVEAWKALKLRTEAAFIAGRVHAVGAYVWPEEEET